MYDEIPPPPPTPSHPPPPPPPPPFPYPSRNAPLVMLGETGPVESNFTKGEGQEEGHEVNAFGR